METLLLNLNTKCSAFEVTCTASTYKILRLVGGIFPNFPDKFKRSRLRLLGHFVLLLLDYLIGLVSCCLIKKEHFLAALILNQVNKRGARSCCYIIQPC